MGALFERYNVEPIKGADITIGNSFPEVFVSESDEIFCYAGICLSDKEHRRKASFMHPYYMTKKHSTDKEISKEIKSFYRIINGFIAPDNYVDDGIYGNYLYKRIECNVKFPMPDNYYAVLVNHEEDADLTRGVFGLTHNEITAILYAYAKTMGTNQEYVTYPRLTKSVRSVNYCDLTDTWIPEGFPYVAFCNSDYDFSHVSLWGFYRHIQLLTNYRIDSAFSRVLLKSGADEKILERIFNLKIQSFYRTKVTKDIFDNY